MVELVCVLFTGRNVFSVQIDENQSLIQLKEMIKTENPNTIKCDANELQLIRINKNNTLLQSCSENSKKKVPVAAFVKEMPHKGKKLRSDDDLAALLNSLENATNDSIHLLVWTPDDDFRRMMLFYLMVPRRAVGVCGFTDKLCEFYGCYRREKSWVRCMLLDVAFPMSLVSPSRLFYCSKKALALRVMHISDMDDERNGLLLFKPLENAFHEFQISFIADDSGVLRLKLFDTSIRDTRLIDHLDHNYEEVLGAAQFFSRVLWAKTRCHFDPQTTFGDIDGSELTFTGAERPFYRCLNLHARRARNLALRLHWIEDSYNFSDFSELALEDKVETFEANIDEFMSEVISTVYLASHK